MKKWLSYVMVSFVFYIVVAMQWQSVYAELYVSNYDIIANVLPNGDVQFIEQLEFDSDSVQNGVYYHLDYRGEKTPIDVYVSDQDGNRLSLVGAQERNVYSVEDTGEYLKFKIFYPFKNTRIRVNIHYTIPELITNYTDVAELNRVFVGAGWEIDQENIRFTLTLPTAADYESLRAWAHAHTQGKVTVHDDYQGVTMEAPFNRAGDKIEARVIFPTSITPENTNIVAENAKERILAHEAQLAKVEVEKEEKRQMIGNIALTGGVVSFLGIIVSLVISFKQGYMANKKRLASVPLVPDHLFELPEDITPAVMSQAIYLQPTTVRDVSATVMDLIRKGVLKISDTEPYELTKRTDKQVALRLHEEWLLKFLIDRVGNGRSVFLADLETYAKKHDQSYMNAIETFERYVAQEAEPLLVTRFSKEEPTNRSVKSFVMACIMMPILLFSTVFLSEIPSWWIGLLVLGAVLVGLTIWLSGVFATRRTIDGEHRYRLWQAFKQMLVDISHLDMAEVPSIVIWDHFLVYAMALGVAKRVIKVLTALIPEQLQQSSFYSVQYGWQMMTYQRVLTSSIGRSFHTASQRVSSRSNASGYGGGFSSGGFSGGSGGGSGGGGF